MVSSYSNHIKTDMIKGKFLVRFFFLLHLIHFYLTVYYKINLFLCISPFAVCDMNTQQMHTLIPPPSVVEHSPTLTNTVSLYFNLSLSV